MRKNDLKALGAETFLENAGKNGARAPKRRPNAHQDCSSAREGRPRRFFEAPEGSPRSYPYSGTRIWRAGETDISEQINAENGVLSTFRCMALPGPYQGGEKKGWAHPTLP